jgi:hypothetical protein
MKSLRIPAFACVLLTASLLAFARPQAPTLKPGVERWPIKTSLATGVDPSKSKTVAFGDLIQLADPPGAKKNDPAFQSARIPAFSNSLNAKEGDILTVTGWLHIIATESDGDYHIQISANRNDGNQCLIVEIPRPEAEFVASADLRPLFDAARTLCRTKLLHGANTEPSSTGNCMAHPPFVQVTGQLFYDDSHVGDPPRGKKQQHAATLWELHPVTKFAFAAIPANAEPLGTPCK